MRKEVRWSKKAIQEFRETLEYWYEHNQSTTYGERLTLEAGKLITFLSKYPDSGKPTHIPSVKAKICATHYLIIYRIKAHHIRIMRFWDTRRSPKSLKRYFE